MNGAAFRDIITQAQGELALEEFLKSVREYWQTFALDLVQYVWGAPVVVSLISVCLCVLYVCRYQNKCKLIRGWDDLFAKLNEHLGSLTSMKMSPFFKVFEDDAQTWEDKLNRMVSHAVAERARSHRAQRELFDIWIEVQRRWVYLESIFTSGGDIATLLPKETARFKGVNTEFLGVMRKVAKSPAVSDVVAIESIQKTQERLLEVLKKVQKALGDYLERQRASFPRFYFIGDEDLLEIIGNAKDIEKLQKHLRKMFAGVSLLQLDETGQRVLGMASAEGEEVPFAAPVVLKNAPKVHQWLTRVEAAMRLTLADRLRLCVAAAAKLDLHDSEACKQWIVSWPAQLVQLAMQTRWTSSVEAALGAADSASGERRCARRAR